MSTQYDDPNREAVGLAPIWTGAGDEVTPSSAEFDPGEHTVAEVEEYLAEHPDEHAKVLAAEAKGKNRTSLVGAHDE